jgi:hypothetical protein
MSVFTRCCNAREIMIAVVAISLTAFSSRFERMVVLEGHWIR